jgi:hypothetical protein
MSLKTKYWIGGIFFAIVIIYFFVPPLVDFNGGGSRFNQWLHRNDPLKSVKGSAPEYAGSSDHPTTHDPIPVK